MRTFASIVWAITLLTFVNSAAAIDCSNSVPITRLKNVLQKSENVHGNRGVTLIFQNTKEWPGKRALRILDAQCNVIGRMGLWPEAKHCPYGYRYYSRFTPGSSGLDAKSMKRKAMAATGSSTIFFEGKDKWIEVTSPTKTRSGSIWSPPTGWCNNRR